MNQESLLFHFFITNVFPVIRFPQNTYTVKANYFSAWSSNVVAYFLLLTFKERNFLIANVRSAVPLILLISSSDLANTYQVRPGFRENTVSKHAKAKKWQTSGTVPLFFDGKVPVTDASNTVFPSADMLQVTTTTLFSGLYLAIRSVYLCVGLLIQVLDSAGWT